MDQISRSAVKILPFVILVALVLHGPDIGAQQKIGRWSNVVRQSTSATCGPAALATLWTFFFFDPTSEEEAMKLTGTDKSTVTNLKQLQNASTAKGYQVEGRNWNIVRLRRHLKTETLPVLVHLSKPTDHFVLVVGYVDGYLLVTDPADGNYSIHETDFTRRWDGKILLVRSAKPINEPLIHERRRSAEIRLDTLNRANRITLLRRF
jgi:predicted double-glycine peptidase